MRIKLWPIFTLLLLLFSCKKNEPADGVSGTVTDVDGNTYQVVKIGSQYWTATNLKVTHYRNGDAITLTTAPSVWNNNVSTGAMCYYQNNIAYADSFGALYNWFAVTDQRNICPPGFHIPSVDEWKTLANYLGGATIAGGKIKSTGTWAYPNSGATNETGFNGQPAGFRIPQGTFDGIGEFCIWWSTTPVAPTDTVSVYSGQLTYSGAGLGNAWYYRRSGASIRCIKD